MRATAAPDLLTANSLEVRLFLLAWHENGRGHFERLYPNLDYDSRAYRKVAVERKRWICLNEGEGSGCLIADRATGEVYTIKAYGRPNRRIGTLASLTEEYTR